MKKTLPPRIAAGPTSAERFNAALWSDTPLHLCHGGEFVIGKCAGCRKAVRKAQKADAK